MIVKDDMELGAHKASRCAINKQNGGCMVGRSSEIYTDAGSGFPFRNFVILTQVQKLGNQKDENLQDDFFVWTR